jgi:hypothetical protein
MEPRMDFPAALDGLAMGALGLGLACAALFALDRRAGSGRGGHLIWPLAAAFGALLWLLFYLREGRADAGSDSITQALAWGVAVALAFALGLAWRRFKGGVASAGAASLVAWQLGMYAFLAFGQIAWIVGARL